MVKNVVIKVVKSPTLRQWFCLICQIWHTPSVWPTVMTRNLEKFMNFSDFRWFSDPLRNFIRSEVVSSGVKGQKVDHKSATFLPFS